MASRPDAPGAKVSVAGIMRRASSFFIARRLPGGDLGGKWEFPGGKVEAGESEEAALAREIREEFGAEARVGAFLAESSFRHSGREYRLRAYEASFDAASLELREHSEWRWATREEISALDFAESDSMALALLPLP